MVKTVNDAFDKFMRDSVNLDPQDVSDAKDSKNHLVDIISSYDSDDFFHLCQDFNEEFGSFARKTKMGILDDIDMMFGLSADGATYNSNDNWQNVRVYGNHRVKQHQECMDEKTGLLNSRLVLNKFKDRLGQTYSTSDHPVRNGEAIKLKLTYNWSFDVVPCFYTVEDFFLIPNGYGGWKKTDPTKDRDFVKKVNKKHNGKVLPLVRLCKKWFEVKNVRTPASYMIETMVVNYCNDRLMLSEYIDLEFRDLLNYLRYAVYYQVVDMKGIQDDVNELSDEEKEIISFKAYKDYKKACLAIKAELDEKDWKKSINLWGEIFGEDFPAYG